MQSHFRLSRLAAHILSGVITILFLFPWLNRPERERRIQHWAAKLLAILHIRVKLTGQPPIVRRGGALIVANHVSWLDIHLLHSVLPARFISKAEVRAWPVFGFLAEATGTLFLERSRRSDAARMNNVMVNHLRQGECLALFPEGTTTDGSRLLSFYPSLFQPAVESGAQVWPALIRYRRPDGSHNPEAAYNDDISLKTSLGRILKQTEIIAELDFLPPINTQGLTRREIAKAAENAMRDALVGVEPDSAPETNDRLRAGTR